MLVWNRKRTRDAMFQRFHDGTNRHSPNCEEVYTWEKKLIVFHNYSRRLKNS